MLKGYVNIFTLLPSDKETEGLVMKVNIMDMNSGTLLHKHFCSQTNPFMNKFFWTLVCIGSGMVFVV